MANLDKIQADVATLRDCGKAISESCLKRVKVQKNQELRNVDRRINRISRRHVRIMKCERRNAKLEQFEGTVDEVMDWICDAESLLSTVVEATYEAVKERVEKLEVRA